MQLSIGERIEMRRRQRGLSRKVVANLVGRSEEWLRLVETGQRKLDSVEAIGRLADVLRVEDLTELTGWSNSDTWSRDQLHDENLRALREVIIDHPAVGTYADICGADGSDPDTLARTLADCRSVWNGSARRYSLLSRRLPEVLRAIRIQRWKAQTEESGELLVRTYHLTRQLLTGFGAHGLAGTVADRAMGTAAQTHQPLLVATSAWHVGTALLHLEYGSESRDYALAARQRLSERMPSEPEELTVWGALLLLAARGATDRLDHVEAATLLDDAAAAADKLGSDHDVDGIPFGPTEIGIAGVQIALAENDAENAIRLAAQVDLPDDYLLERRTKHYIGLASAYAARGDDVAAAYALIKAADGSPEDLRHDWDAHRTLQRLIRRDNHVIRTEVSRLVQLAELT
ncbi:helix-turn-helix domain-containing protein [Nocardia sp. NPDC051570]|uniref:helix-turn-helix domain-containing protein n=1 Tax=Nocardia sp. NPDC051570 TaxID=3364324 RepID=UPI00379FB777